MSEQGWREFLSAEGIDDWVVLHGGATAVFRVGSLDKAIRLAEAIAKIPGLEGKGILLTIGDDFLTVRLTRDLWQLEPQHIELARAISDVAREYGALADRSAVQEVQVAIAAKQDEIDVNFWRAVLGYLPMADDNAVDPLGHGSTVWMQEIDANKPIRHAMHIGIGCARASPGTTTSSARCRRTYCRRLPCARILDPCRPRRESCLYRLMARRLYSATAEGR